MNGQRMRQIHLDFHTSPLIPDVGAEFDPDEFVSTLKEARVNSINIFAKCHHGMCYYPTKLGRMHPALKFDLVGEMLGALAGAGIGAQIYFTAGWDEVSADNSNWLEVNREGVLGGVRPFESRWRKLCLNKKSYVDLILAQTDEIIERYRGLFEGFWYDIVFQKGCVCRDCIADMKRRGLEPADPADQKKHDYIVILEFMERVYNHVKLRLPGVAVFFNTKLHPDGAYDEGFAIKNKLKYLTNIEIESLPSEKWGYNHFPLYVSYLGRGSSRCVGMNGRFHTAWGDFGSLRNREALEYECFRMIMHGAACCVGDQLHPRGRLDKKVYERIGEVYRQIEEREAFCHGSEKLAEVGVLTANRPLETAFESDEGALRMLMELHYSFDIIDVTSDFSRYRLLILPDRVICNDTLAQKLSAYVAGGGAVIATCRSGLDPATGKYLFREAGIEYLGDSEYCPEYISVEKDFREDLAGMEYVLYERGANVRAAEGAEVLAWQGRPYFNRTYDVFCSHRHFPFDRLTGRPAIVRSGRVIYISSPLFGSYRVYGVRAYRDIVEASIKALLGTTLLESDLPPSAEVALRRQGGRLILHILHYIPERKCKKLDIVDTKIPLYNRSVAVRTGRKPRSVCLVPGMRELPFAYEDGYTRLTLPEINGHVMVVFE
jgi:hypothetical protein